MEIKTKYNLWDEAFIIEDKAIYRIYITWISLDVDEEGIEIEYDYKQEFPEGLSWISIEDWEDYVYEEDIYSTLKQAQKVLDKIISEEEAKEERRKQYKELKEEFETCSCEAIKDNIKITYSDWIVWAKN